MCPGTLLGILRLGPDFAPLLSLGVDHGGSQVIIPTMGEHSGELGGVEVVRGVVGYTSFTHEGGVTASKVKVDSVGTGRERWRRRREGTGSLGRDRAPNLCRGHLIPLPTVSNSSSKRNVRNT